MVPGHQQTLHYMTAVWAALQSVSAGDETGGLDVCRCCSRAERGSVVNNIWKKPGRHATLRQPESLLAPLTASLLY